MKKKYWQLVTPFTSLFVILNTLLIVFRTKLESKGFDVDVVIVANVLLVVISMLNIYSQYRNMQHPNPRAAVRGVMAGTLLKLVVVATAVLIYLFVAGANRNRPGVFAGMGLYVLYTLLEVRISLKMNQKK